jgi:hypothetical protein
MNSDEVPLHYLISYLYIILLSSTLCGLRNIYVFLKEGLALLEYVSNYGTIIQTKRKSQVALPRFVG